MKRLVRLVCLILAFSLFLTIPSYAQSAAESRGSAFFASYGTDLYKFSSTSFEIWFDVNANAAIMDVIGVSEIIVYQSADQQHWTQTRTFYMEDWPEMIDTNTYSHTGYVTYNFANPGYYYTAYITFYAKDSRGIGERDVYTEILKM
ncbi:MAG: hypothetical protein IJA74_03030 [Oscillospiraceae bacterium]|nr:hypothetical protein [Oscillospiraceae bacterium]